MKIIQVALAVNYINYLHYCTEDICVSPNNIIIVPFRKTKCYAIVLSEEKNQAEYKLRPILDNLGQKYSVSKQFLTFLIKTSKYYGASLGCVLKSTFPSQALFEQNIEHKKKLYIHNPNLPELSTEQQNALNYINNITSKESSKTIVLHGVTGSGKTEIYFHFISKILNQGKQILLLVPEIGLSKQLVDQCTNRFNTSVSIWHSKIRKPLREKMFAQIVNNETKIIIGVRSAVFYLIKI